MLQSFVMEKRRGYFVLITAILIWGTTFFVTKIVLREIGPLQLTGIRFLLGFALMAPLAARKGFKLKDIFKREFMLFGLTGTALYYALENLGMAYTTITATVLIQSILPVLTAILAVIFLKERLNVIQIIGIIMVTIGMVLVSLDTTASTDAPNPLLGNLLIFLGCISWAVYTIQGSMMVSNYSTIVMAAASTGAGAVLLAPFVGWEIAVIGLPHLSLIGWLGILYLGLVASGSTTYLWNEAIRYLPASVASTYLNLVPVIALVTSFFVGERPPLIQVIGGVLAILGVWLAGKTGKTEKTTISA